MATRETVSAWRCKEGFAVPSDVVGMARVIREGTLVPNDDPIIKTHRRYFQPVEEFIETTTARPGEQRHAHIPPAPQPIEEVTP